tara:strand:+ start:218 stop:970 length:753 start_codon:yes stop_codon:yes gene_type:complete
VKLILENWRKYLNEEQGVTYFWQTRGPWKAESLIDFGTTHVPKAKPFNMPIEEIFEEVRRAKFPDRPSRLNCVYLCDNVKGWDGNSFCSYPARGDGETYQVQLRGEYNIFKTNSEYWTEASLAYQRYKDEDSVRRWANTYWKGDADRGPLEILVSPPESAIIIAKYEEESKEDLHKFKDKAGDYLEDAMGDWFYDEPYGWDDIDPDKLSREEFFKAMKVFFDKMHKDITPLLKGVKTKSDTSSNKEVPGI